MIVIHPSEVRRITARGGQVSEGLLMPGTVVGRCPFQNPEHLCDLHGTGAKPFGCIASPFTLNERDTLIVRNRYRLLPCYDTDQGGPAYAVFFSSLRLIFGWSTAWHIREHLEAGRGDLAVLMPDKAYRMLKDNDAVERKVKDQ